MSKIILHFMIVNLFTLNSFAQQIRVAIIDTGVDLENKVITRNLWTNTGEIPNNKIDDDENGFVDDLHGWNFADDNSNINDSHGHGTHISGLILDQTSGIEIMILKYYGNKNNTLRASLDALKYAIENGAQIINYSGGGHDFSHEEFQLLKIAETKGVLIVAAVGNDGANLSKSPFFPANYSLSNIISVGAYDKKLSWLKYSNYHLRSVDILAPGEQILSYSILRKSSRGDNWARMTGTSQATAQVTRALAQYWRQSNSSDSLVVKYKFLSTQPRMGKLLGKARFGTYLPL